MASRRLKFPPAPPVDLALAQAPANRDRLIDAVRAFSILIVVAGHGFLAMVAWRNDVPRAGNVLAIYPNGQLITWIFQVMPLFFFAGGYANAISWENRSDKTYAQWLWTRTNRLLRPLWTYLALMIPVALVLGSLAPTKISSPMLVISTQLLWFLGIYLIVTSLTPVLYSMERRHEGTLIIALVIAIALFDVVRFNRSLEALSIFNFVFVWSLLTTLGMRFRRGLLSPREGGFLALTAVAINVLLVLVLQWYPRSMVGMPGDRISNVAPPTLALTLHGIVVIGLVTAMARWIRGWMENARAWRAVIGINLVMMTIYLWHLPMLTALFLIERFVGFERPAEVIKGIGPVPDTGFWLSSPGHWIAFVILVVFAVRLLWPLEHMRLPIWDSHARMRLPAPFAAIGALLVGISLLMLSASGLTLIPLRVISYLGLSLNAVIALVLLVAGATCIKWAGNRVQA